MKTTHIYKALFLSALFLQIGCQRTLSPAEGTVTTVSQTQENEYTQSDRWTAPEMISIDAISSSKIQVGWINPDILDAHSIVLEQKNIDLGGPFTVVETISAPTSIVSAIVENLQAGTSYQYRMRTIRGDEASSYSQVRQATTLGTNISEIASPQITQVSSNSSSSIQIIWTNPSITQSHTVILEQKKVQAGANFQAIQTLLAPTSVSSYTSSGLLADTTYEYRMRTIIGGQTSSYSSIFTATTQNEIVNTTIFPTPYNLHVNGNDLYISQTNNIFGVRIAYDHNVDSIPGITSDDYTHQMELSMYDHTSSQFVYDDLFSSSELEQMYLPDYFTNSYHFTLVIRVRIESLISSMQDSNWSMPITIECLGDSCSVN